MDKIIIKNFRCFDELISPELKPITLLVGENSSGKSTFLASTRLAWDLCSLNTSPDFNEEPFSLGSWDQISHYMGGSIGRALEMKIGTLFDLNESILEKSIILKNQQLNHIEICAILMQDGSNPVVKKWEFNAGKYFVHIEFLRNHINLSVNSPYKKFKENKLPFNYFVSSMAESQFLPYFLQFIIKGEGRKRPAKEKLRVEKSLDAFQELFDYCFSKLGKRPIAFAPVRTKPQRTYDPLKEVSSPEGAHIPMTLANLKATNPEAWGSLKTLINSYGVESGLFKNVSINRLGGKASNPFQLRLKIFGPSFNLVDVGYGVSQILPILVEVLNAEKNTILLIQQPEVHLHPKAQSELASFLFGVAYVKKIKIIIETHSDYIVDRVRTEIRDLENYKKEDATIVFFDRSSKGINVHQIELDDNGNIINAPKGYRKFFLEEEKRLWGISNVHNN